MKRKLINDNKNITIQFVTFGYKNGIVNALDYYYDLRKLPNDAWVVDDYKNKNGRDDIDIQELIFKSEKVIKEYGEIKNDILKSITNNNNNNNNCINNNNNTICIGIGCKSGLHRSVSFAEKVYHELNVTNQYTFLENNHLDIKDDKNTNNETIIKDGNNYNNILYQRRNDDQFICVICNDLKCNDAKQMNEHLQSKKHRKKLLKHKKKKTYHATSTN